MKYLTQIYAKAECLYIQNKFKECADMLHDIQSKELFL